jgi:hypothetical protein
MATPLKLKQMLESLAEKEDASHSAVGRRIFNMHMYVAQQKPTAWMKDEVIQAGELHSKSHLEKCKIIENVITEVEALQKKCQESKKKMAAISSENFQLQQELKKLQDEELSFSQAANYVEEGMDTDKNNNSDTKAEKIKEQNNEAKKKEKENNEAEKNEEENNEAAKKEEEHIDTDNEESHSNSHTKAGKIEENNEAEQN